MKKSDSISYRLVAFTDAAGKYTPEAFRSGNEDNFYVKYDLSQATDKGVAQDEIIQLGKFGMLMVVADGMGGMNAGEVASQIAVDTVRDLFVPEMLTPDKIDDPHMQRSYLESVIEVADRAIKKDASQNPDHNGMGSTIIIAWLLGNRLTVSWCGDSRAYIFNEKSGIRLISQDHSYVQELVNKGLLTYDQTFDHPQNNIITRSLGDPTKRAKAQSKSIKVGKGDVILLCSDGLSGVLRDRKTYDPDGKLYPEENLEDIIRAHTGSMKECREALWAAAERGGWYDNVTAILCQITEGPESHWGNSLSVTPGQPRKRKSSRAFLFLLAGLLIIGIALGAYFLGRESNEGSGPKEKVATTDSVASPTDAKASQQIAAPSSDEAAAQGETRREPRKSIQERVKEQAAGETQEAEGSELTPIDRQGGNDGASRDRLTPIRDKVGSQDKPTLPDYGPTQGPKSGAKVQPPLPPHSPQKKTPFN